MVQLSVLSENSVDSSFLINLHQKKNFSLFFPLLLTLSLVGSILLFIGTASWGIGVSEDSVSYIAGARNILEGHGFRGYISLSPITQWPPFFPFSLAVLGLLGLDPLQAARFLHVFLFGINIGMVGIILKKFTQSTLIALAGSWLMLTSHSMLTIHSMAWSEPQSIFLTFTGLFFLVRYLGGSSKRYLFYAGILAGIGCLSRYGGIALIAAGVMILLLLSRKNISVRIQEAIAYFILSFLPLGLWLLRNQFLAHDLVNRKLEFRPPPSEYFLQGLNTLAFWTLPLSVPEFLKYLVLALVAATGILGSFLVIRKVRQKTEGNIFATDNSLRMMASLTLFVICYLGIHLVHLIFMYTYAQANDRQFSTVFVAGLLGSLLLVNYFFKCYPYRFILKIIAISFFILLGSASLWSATQNLMILHQEGAGFTARIWQTSPTIAKINALPADALIYSNEPSIIYTLTRRITNHLPRKYDKSRFRREGSAEPKEDLLQRINKMKEKLISKKGYVIFFNDRHRWYKLPKQELKQHIPMILTDQLSDGAIYRINPVEPAKPPAS